MRVCDFIHRCKKASTFWNKRLKSWNIQNLTALFNPAGLAWISEGKDLTASSARLFLTQLCEHNSSVLPRPQTHSAAHPSPHRSFPYILHCLCCGHPPQPHCVLLSHKKHTLLHLLTFLQLHSSTVTRSCRKYHFFCFSLLFPFLCFALGTLEPRCNCLLCLQLFSFLVTRPHIHIFAHSHAQYKSFFPSILQIKSFPVYLRRKHQRSENSQIR